MKPEQNTSVPRKPPTQQYLKVVRFTLQREVISPQLTIYYSLGKKDSNWGLFSNERMLLYHNRQKSLRYYTSIPKHVPFLYEQDVTQGKQKVFIRKVDKFKCEAVAGKISTFKVEWEADKQKHEWIFNMGSSKAKSDWITLLNQELHLDSSKSPQLPQHSNNNLQPNNLQPNNLEPNNIQYNNSQPNNSQPNNLQPNNSQPNSDTLKPQDPSFVLKQQPLVQDKKYQEVRNTHLNPQQVDYNRDHPSEARRDPQNSRQMPLENNKNQTIHSDPDNPRPYIVESRVNQNISFNRQPESLHTSNANQLRQPDLPSKYGRSRLQQQIVDHHIDRNKVNRETVHKESHHVDPNTHDIIHQVHHTEYERREIHYDDDAKKNKSHKDYIREDIHEQIHFKKQPQNDYSRRPIADMEFEGSRAVPTIDNPAKSRATEYKESFPKSHHGLRQVASSYQRPVRHADSRTFDGPPHQERKDQIIEQSNRIHIEASRNYSRGVLNRQQNHRKWNEEWCQSDANSQIQLYEQFVDSSEKLSRSIIDELPFMRKDRQFAPLQENAPFSIYHQEGIIVVLHFQSRNTAPENQYNEYSPLLYDQQSYTQVQREFKNYDLIVSVTGNRGFIKMPLCCYFEYKGLLALCKAETPNGFHRVDTRSYQGQIQALQELIKVRFPYGQFALFSHPSAKYVIMNDLSLLIPTIPNGMHPPDYFIKDFLTNYEDVLESRQSITQAHRNIMSTNIKQFLGKIETLDPWIVDTKDLTRQLNMAGISFSYLPDIFQQSNCPHLKKTIASQLTAQIFSQIIRSQLSNIYVAFPTNQFQQLSTTVINSIILDGLHVLINEFFSYSLRAENIWKVVVNQLNKQYRIVISKQDVIVGYLLSAIISKNALQCDFKTSGFDKGAGFFVKEKTIPRKLLVDFRTNINRYKSADISPQLREIESIVYDTPSQQGFQQIIRKMSLRKYQIPKHCWELYDPLVIYLCNFIPFDDDRDFEHLDLYRGIITEPHNYYTMKASILAVKWCIKRRNIQTANQIFEDKCQENTFWLGEFNASVSQFYDFFAIFNASVGNYDQSIKLSKSSLVNCIKILGNGATSTADKHYQLGNIYFRASKKEEALKQYAKTKHILHENSQTKIPEYGMILLKMSLLYLNFGKMKDCVVNALEALKTFDVSGSSQQDQVETFEILARAYEITRKSGDMASVGALCSQKFNESENPKVVQKMMKIVLLPKLSDLKSQESKSLQNILFKLQEMNAEVSYLQAFSYLHRLATSGMLVMKKTLSLIDNLGILYEDITRKDLFRKHKSLSYEAKSEAEQMLVLLEAISTMVGYGFMLGSLKDSYSQ